MMYEQIYNLDNLYKASLNAQKGKKSKDDVAKFWLYETREISRMHQELKTHMYQWGGYKAFEFNDHGVKRRISVAPFRDRVLHHAIMQQIEPLFEKSFIYDTYANRKGKGTLKALQRAKYYANKYKYVLQLDIRKFFPSIGHERLKKILFDKVTCIKTQQLLSQLIDHSNRQEDAYFYFANDTLFTPYTYKKGIPLGNLTSQFFGNIYLSDFDHYVKEKLKVKGYIRYVDDTIYFSNSKIFLMEIVGKIKDYLAQLRLKIHPLKIKLLSSKEGFIFLGHKVFNTHFRLTSKSIRRGRKKLKKLHYTYAYSELSLALAKNRLFGTLGFFSMGSNTRISEELLAQSVFKKIQ